MRWRGRGRLRRTRVAALLVLLVVSGAGGAQALGQDGLSDIVIDDARITESSGLAVSPTDDDLLYTVNDSGNDPVVYVVDRGSGEVVGTTALDGVDSDTDDLEALSVAAEGRLWVADIGDNGSDRSDIALYTLPAPTAAADSLTPVRYPLRYGGGPVDAEALVVDPVTGAAWLVTKQVLGGAVLALPGQLSPGETATPQPVDGVDVPGLVTDGTVLPGGHAVVLRTYGQAHVYRLPDWSLVGTFPLPRSQQGESLTALSDTMLLAGSEGSPALIDEVPMPADVTAALGGGRPTRSPPADARERPSTAEPQDEGERAGLVAAVVGVGLLGLAAWALARRRGRRTGR